MVTRAIAVKTAVPRAGMSCEPEENRTTQDFEKLGVFYLGCQYDLGAKSLTDNLVLYDSKNLVTHAVLVGMTGSGKTGLCIDRIQEAAIDGIPSILIDPKGDLANLLLTFPGLTGSDFQPWVNEDDAAKKGLSVADYAVQQAELWNKGLGDGGDLNDTSQPVHLLYAAGHPDYFTALGLQSPPTLPSMPTCARLPNEPAPSQTLDWIVSNRNARAVAAQAPQFYFGDISPSDHWPVLAVYEIGP